VIKIKQIRVDKILSSSGIGSRKEVKKYIRNGLVHVDGKVIDNPGLLIDPMVQKICFQGQEVFYQQFYYYMLNKPAGFISATEDKYDQTVMDLLKPKDQKNLFPVGRLDKDTEGLLLLTNDGELTHNLLSPKKKVPKTYYAKIQGQVTKSDKIAFQSGVLLDDGYHTLPSELKIITSGDISEIELTICEGKFHQVKRMFISRGQKVIYLKRISMGSLKLDENLDLGEYRPLTEKEIKELKVSI